MQLQFGPKFWFTAAASKCTVPRQSAVEKSQRYYKRMKRFGAPLTAWRWTRSVLIAVGVLLGTAFVLYIQQNPDRPVETLAYTGLFKLSAVACFSLVSFMQAITGVASATDVSEGPANASGMYSMMLGCGLLLSCLGDFSLEMHLSGREVLFMVSIFPTISHAKFHGARPSLLSLLVVLCVCHTPRGSLTCCRLALDSSWWATFATLWLSGPLA